jgi:hypothetical protein
MDNAIHDELEGTAEKMDTLCFKILLSFAWTDPLELKLN